MTQNTIANPADFIFAGRARFSVTNTISGRSFRFAVGMNKEKSVFFVRDISTSDRGTYLGFMIADARDRLIAGRKGDDSAPAFRAFAWLLANLDNLGPVAVMHEDACGRCGRRLDDPVSCALGIGPVCAKHMGISHATPEKIIEDISGPVYAAQTLAQAVGHVAGGVYPFRSEKGAGAYLDAMTDGGDLELEEALMMYADNPEEIPPLAKVAA